MNQSIYFETVDDYNKFNNHETLHPLVSVIDFSKAHKRTGSKMYFNLYCIFLKDVKCGDLKYGRATYDYQEGTLVFVSPGQVVDVENKVDIYQPLGHGLVFHPDLIKGTPLAKSISDYGFFDYQTNEALHLSKKEQQMVWKCSLIFYLNLIDLWINTARKLLPPTSNFFSVIVNVSTTASLLRGKTSIKEH
nr:MULTISPECIES: hypothetical protein [Epilithonimonas]